MSSSVWDAPDSGADVAEGGEVAEAAEVDTEEVVDVEGVDNADPQLDAEADDANPLEGAPEGDDAAPDVHTVKVDGEEFEVTTEELKAGYSRMRASTKRFQEAAELKKQVQGFVGHLRSGDPEVVAELFTKIGVDFTEVAEKHLASYLADMERPQHEREMRKLEREREAFRREQQTAQQRAQEERLEQEAAREQARYKTEMTSALEAAGLPASGPMLGKVARELEMALTHGYEMTVSEAVQIVNEETRALIRKLDPQAAARLLGQDGASSLRKQEAAAAAAEQKRRNAQVASRGRRSGGGGQSVPRAVNPESMSDLKALFDS